MDGYYVGTNVPEIFKIADEIVYRNKEKYDDIDDDLDDTDIDEDIPEKKKKKDKKKKIKKIKVVEDDKSLKKKKDKKEKKKDDTEKVVVRTRKDYEIEMIQILAKIDLITRKLEELNPGKDKDAVKIAAYNVDLRNMKERLVELEKASGIKINELETGTKFGRFVSRVKTKGRKLIKKAKKFFKHNKELIAGIFGIVAPVVTAAILKAVLHI
jgi:hypothetical protein